jgi:hypothetical protein
VDQNFSTTASIISTETTAPYSPVASLDVPDAVRVGGGRRRCPDRQRRVAEVVGGVEAGQPAQPAGQAGEVVDVHQP